MRLAYSEGLGFFCERIDIRKISLESSAVEKIGNSEFQQKAPNYYNFDVIISISLSDEMTIKATTKAVIKYLEAIRKKHKEEILFACGYEAGPTGYGLCRGLQKAGYGCVVMAPTTMSNPDGKKRVKTDRIDARAIARILAYKSYSQVHLPSEEMEALKEYTRARDAKKRMFKKAKQELYFFRIGFFEFHYFKEVFFLFFIFLVFMIKKITKKNNLIKTIQISLCYGQRN